MHRGLIVGLLILAVALVGPHLDADIKLPLVRSREVPTVNLPNALRQRNWLGSQREGSCVHASWMMLLRWQGMHDWAAWWGRQYGNGEYWDRMVQRCDDAGLNWAGTYDKFDVSFLEWAIRTRRGCMVTVMNGRHMVVLVHLDAERAGILDNNDINTIHWVSRDIFLAEWKASRSWAMTPVYSPAPPLEVQ